LARYAVIDVGTNTLRLLVAQPSGPGDYAVVHEEQEVTRLGEGLMPERLLLEEPRRRSLAVLERFAQVARRFNAEQVAVVGTSAVREARNREEFAQAIARETGLTLHVIEGEEEARLTLLGVQHGLRLGSRRILLIDVGGGSTEFILARGGTIDAAVSTGLGVVKLTERHLQRDPPAPAELEALEQAVAVRIDRLHRELPPLGAAELVGTAGTPTTLAAIDLTLPAYDRRKVHGHVISHGRVKELFASLARLPVRERRQVPGLEPGRADVIVAGTAILIATMERLRFEELRVSDDGLREGILLDLLRTVGPSVGPPFSLPGPGEG
jgi:exopolyphosphatase/guanosine-5'-triphosphate,3'-diphosphate pyrophosphatase